MNDFCQNAHSIHVGESLSGSTASLSHVVDNEVNIVRCADDGTFDVGNPGLWFAYESTEVRELKLTTCHEQTNFQHRITAYSSESGECTEQTCAESSIVEDPNCASGNSTILTLPTMIGSKYHFHVLDRFVMDSGDFVLSLIDESPSPENDRCLAAELLVAEEIVQGTTVGARTPGRLDCATPENPGVYYFIPPMPNPANITVSVTGGSKLFDILLFEGDDCGNLVCKEISSNSFKQLSRQIFFDGAANATHYLLVQVSADEEESQEETGRFGIQVRMQEEEEDVPSTAFCATTLFGTTIAIVTTFLTL